MKRAIVVGAVLAATTGAASAGTYLGLGIGPSAGVDGMMQTESGGRSARLLGGYSFGKLGVEASLTGESLYHAATGYDLSARQIAIAGKYSHPLGYNFEAFGKAGLHHTWMTHPNSSSYGDAYNASGSGLLVGFGAEYRFAVGPVKAGSLFLDYTYYRATLESPVQTHDGAAVRMWMIGFTVGL